MFIKELQLVGFKSFQDKATLRFAPGMNAIVGPNGCGKSNVVDALRWILGEQSFTVLRCARNEDLIFGGTAKVPATNLAEVRLLLATDDRPELGAEVEIRRRYFRSGESEYFLNRQPCRLRDITDMFLTAGIGTKAYSIFDLRQIRDIIAGNIRRMFDEAATLAKYQEAKAECLRKLELTATDLTRLEDIILERERIVRSLRRQAGRLQAYRKLKEEEKGYRLIELKLEYDAVARDLVRMQQDTEALERAEADRVTEIHRLEDELRQVRQRVREAQARSAELLAEVNRRRAVLAETENRSLLDAQRAELLEQSAAAADEERARLSETAQQLETLFTGIVARQAEAAERLGQAQQRLDQARQRTQELEAKLFQLRSHEAVVREQVRSVVAGDREDQAAAVRLEAVRDNLSESIERLKREQAACAERARQVETAAADAKRRSDEANQAVAGLRSRGEALRRELAEVRDGLAKAHEAELRLREERGELEKELAVLRAAVASDRARHAAEVLADALGGEVGSFLEVEEGWERACETALYQVLEFMAVNRPVKPLEWDRLAELGPELRFGFVEMAPGGYVASKLPQDPGVVGRLGDHVRVRPGAPGILVRMVSGFLVARDRAEIERLSTAHPQWSYVTRDGLCRFSDGRTLIEGAGRGVLGADRRLRGQSQRLAEVLSALGGLAESVRSLEQRRTSAEDGLSAVEAELVEAERDRAVRDAAVQMATEEAKELDAEQQRLAAETANLEARRRATGEKAAPLQARLTEADGRMQAAQRAAAAATEQVAAQEKLVRAALDAAAEALAAQAEERQAVSRLETEGAYAKRSLDETRRRVAALQTEATGARAEAQRLREGITARVAAIEEARRAVGAAEEAAGAVGGDEMLRVQEDLEKNLDELRAHQERNRGALLEQRMKRYELERQAAALADEARQGHGADITTIAVEPAEDFGPRCESVRRRLEALGEVNQLAAEEYEQERKDLARLVAQRDDVRQARQNLEQTMLEIDRHAREQFLATYAEVRVHFQQVFRELFLEGEADLVLVNEANPLESEIAITARPRGKTPKRLEQLSDGEKALLAVSLLFAFYRVKPAPFCFLDEVDAPLDDINVGRFADYLKRLSETTQVIIITHNRATVERADALFGVTAEQPGISQLVSVSLAQFREQQAATGN